ncbi:MAG: hypothetical protein EOO68_11595 [Moraxellaceae bacterium]|jgi:hypothetical protein|nr:MAG: hypothetical protein EOO68_11595 [Moraxellaceae bacterium]
MDSKYLIIIVLLFLGVTYAVLGSVKDKKIIKKIAAARAPMSKENFLHYFPDAHRDNLEVIFHQLQDMLCVHRDSLFPMEPEDGLWKTYRIQQQEIEDMIHQISPQCEINPIKITSFFSQYKERTVRDLVTMVAH